MNKQRHPVIAVDGTAASGKGTLARRLAEKLGYAYLDTGKLYRYVGYAIIREGQDPGEEKVATAMAERLKDSLQPQNLEDPALQSDEAGQAASKVGAFQVVRAALLAFQKSFAARPPEGAKGVILDGRDIGTVICPDADIKLYIDAQTEVRAQRRYKELHSRGISATYDAVLKDMRERDRRDAGRETAPMKPADDALILDTTHMGIDDVLEKALAHIKEKIPLNG